MVAQIDPKKLKRKQSVNVSVSFFTPHKLKVPGSSYGIQQYLSVKMYVVFDNYSLYKLDICLYVFLQKDIVIYCHKKLTVTLVFVEISSSYLGDMIQS